MAETTFQAGGNLGLAKRKTKILYVDDEQVNLSNFYLAFKPRYEVVTTKDADEALALFRKHGDFSIVVADQRMPGLSGTELLEQMFKIDPDPVRIVLTGFSELEDIIGAINRGHIYQYILKPWKEPDLRRILDRAQQNFQLIKENKYLHKRLIEVAEEERRRIANDLHDDFGQVLPAMRTSLQRLVDGLPRRPSALADEVEHLRGLIDRLGDITRQTAHALRPDLLDRLGLQETISWSILEFRRTHPDIQVSFEVQGAPKAMVPETETILYRLFQEAFNNIAKHADAHNVTVWLNFDFPFVRLAVADDGVGMEQTPPGPHRSDGGGVGLQAMQERVASAQGTLTIRSAPQRGTEIRVQLPL